MEQDDPGVREFAQARRYAIYAVIGGSLAWSAGGVTSSRVGTSLAFILWLGAILTGTQALVAAVVGWWRRSHA